MKSDTEPVGWIEGPIDSFTVRPKIGEVVKYSIGTNTDLYSVVRIITTETESGTLLRIEMSRAVQSKDVKFWAQRLDSFTSARDDVLDPRSPSQHVG